MALNPDDLLIFQAREGEGEEEKKKGKKPEAKPAEQPKAAAAPAPQPKPAAQAAPKPQPASKAAAAPAPKAGGEVTFIAPQKGEEEIPIVTEPMAEAEEFGVPAELAGKKGAAQKQLTGKELRRIAEHMTCELHPWRRAYAICAYCRRAFCYEDLIEHNGLYYDLDDIDKIPKLRASEVIKYNTLGFFAGALMLFVFVVFIAFSFTQVLLLDKLLPTIGLSGILANPLQPVTFILSETVLAVLSLIASISIFASLRLSFRLSTLVSVLTVGLFSYQYLQTNETFLIIITILSFVAIVSLAYSRVAVESLPEHEEMSNAESLEIAKSSF